jgi:hypothetical protein
MTCLQLNLISSLLQVRSNLNTSVFLFAFNRNGKKTPSHKIGRKKKKKKIKTEEEIYQNIITTKEVNARAIKMTKNHQKRLTISSFDSLSLHRHTHTPYSTQWTVSLSPCEEGLCVCSCVI